MDAQTREDVLAGIQEPRYSWPRPAVIRVGRVSCHQGRAFQRHGDTLQRYLVGRQYWRLLSYIQGLWPSLSTLSRIPHLAVSGISGCGKSWTLSAATSFLRQQRLQTTFRVVAVADCQVWMESADPLSFFCMEMMLAFRNDDGVADLDIVKSHIVSRPEELRPWLGVIDRFLERANLRLVVMLDQVESLMGKPDAVPNGVIQALIDMKRTIVVMAMTVDGPSERTAIAHWGFNRLGFHQMHFPYYIPTTDYSYLSDLLFDSPLALHEGTLFREVRLYSGGVMRELVKCLTFGAGDGLQDDPLQPRLPKVITGVEVTTRLEAYRRATIEQVVAKMESTVSKLDRVQRVALLLVIFRMILHLPADAATSSVNLPRDVRSLFLPAVIQKFYHPRDSVAHVLHIPTAVGHCVHLALSSAAVLNMLAERPLQVMHKLIASIMDSKTVCAESKRRMVRFYAHHRLTGGHQVRVMGVTDFEKPMEVDTGKLFVRHHFAGLTPAKDIVAWLLAQAIVAADASKLQSGSAALSDISKAVPIVFIPGRTDYCFFDYFVFYPSAKRLFAVSTAATPSDWQRKSQPPTAAASSPQRESLITPASLVEMWQRVFSDVLPVKFTVHCVSVKPNDLLAAADCPWQPQPQ